MKKGPCDVTSWKVNNLLTWRLTESGMGQDFNHQINVEVVKNLRGLLWWWHGKKKKMTDVTDIWHQAWPVTSVWICWALWYQLYCQRLFISIVNADTLLLLHPWNVMPCIIKHSAEHWDQGCLLIPAITFWKMRLSLCLWHNFQPLLILNSVYYVIRCRQYHCVTSSR